jgi:hypothetical protein
MSICVCSSCESNCIPSPVKQGERVEWEWTLCDYPSDEYTLQFRFRGPGTGFDVNATADADGGDGYDAFKAFGTSLTAGVWAWQAWVTEIADATNTFMVDDGIITIETGFAAAGTGTFETRSAAKIALDTIDAALLAFSSSDVLEYEITTPAGSRRVKRSDKSQLMTLRKHWAMVVSMERTRDRLQNGGKLMKSVPIIVREC